MDEVTITMAMLGTGTGAWIATTGILVALKAKLGDMWSDKANRIASVILPIIFVEAAVAATLSTTWYAYLIGLVVGLGAYQASSSSQTGYDEKVLLAAKETTKKNR